MTDYRKVPPLELRLRVLSAVDFAPGDTLRERFRAVANKTFRDPLTERHYQFTWRTISTWYYRFQKEGIVAVDKKTRSDKHHYRKVSLNELAEAINDILPTLKPNKSGLIPKTVIYRLLLKKRYFHRDQLSLSTFRRMVRENQLLKPELTQKLRLSFAMQFANELWQADTLYGPAIKQSNGSWKKTFLIAFIDDASRVISHAEFFYRDNTHNMIDAFRSALYKRGKPERLYLDNGANYRSREITQACLRLDIRLSHAPIRDGAAKGKIERFFRGLRDRFLTQHLDFKSLDDLNQKLHDWVENEYNGQFHSGIQMRPIDRFNLDIHRVQFINQDAYFDEVFFVEEKRKVSKTNVFSIHSTQFECPVDLREKSIQVRYCRQQRSRVIVYFNEQRMGQASSLNPHRNATLKRDKRYD